MDSLQYMQDAWDRAIRKEFQKPDYYDHVAALIVRWSDEVDRDLSCREEEVEKLNELFKSSYYVRSAVQVLDNKRRSQDQLVFRQEHEVAQEHRHTREPMVIGSLNNAVVSAFPDTGAGSDYISQSFVDRQRLQIDRSTAGVVCSGNGKATTSNGTVTLPFNFWGEGLRHERKFTVLPKCIHDVTLGGPFLRATKTLTDFKSRIQFKMRASRRDRVLLTGQATQRVLGYFNGHSVGAVPDTGSDVMLISKEYVQRLSLDIIADQQYCRLLEFFDGTQDRTCGLVRDVKWTFGDLDDPDSSYMCDFLVLDGMTQDVVLSADFLFETDAFTRFEDCYYEEEDLFDRNGLNMIREMEENDQKAHRGLRRRLHNFLGRSNE